MDLVSQVKSFGGNQAVYSHASDACACDMRFGVYTPPADLHGPGPYPALFWLSGLTCTEENFITKAGAQRAASELGIMIIAPDTSPRGEGVADDTEGAYDFGLGAGFYVDATQAPWSAHYKMYSYVACELPSLIEARLPVDENRMGIFGHSMGGHGALTLHLRHPDLFRSCSAFAPIVAPSLVPWGQKALGHYLGADQTAWAGHDACRLVEAMPSPAHILIDQGSADPFLDEQLKPDLFAAAAEKAGQKTTIHLRDGYDHSYYFIASFIEDHLRWHAAQLGPAKS